MSMDKDRRPYAERVQNQDVTEPAHHSAVAVTIYETIERQRQTIGALHDTKELAIKITEDLHRVFYIYPGYRGKPGLKGKG